MSDFVFRGLSWRDTFLPFKIDKQTQWCLDMGLIFAWIRLILGVPERCESPRLAIPFSVSGKKARESRNNASWWKARRDEAEVV